MPDLRKVRTVLKYKIICMTQIFSSRKDKVAAIKSLSALAINLSAGWLGVAIISPNFWPIAGPREILLLTADLILGTLCWWLSFRLEKKLI